MHWSTVPCPKLAIPWKANYFIKVSTASLLWTEKKPYRSLRLVSWFSSVGMGPLNLLMNRDLPWVITECFLEEYPLYHRLSTYKWPRLFSRHNSVGICPLRALMAKSLFKKSACNVPGSVSSRADRIIPSRSALHFCFVFLRTEKNLQFTESDQLAQLRWDGSIQCIIGQRPGWGQ